MHRRTIAWIVLAGIYATKTAHADADGGKHIPTELACVGDSITAGVGASSGATDYVADLAKLFGAGTNVVGFGHVGATMMSNSVMPTVPYVAQPEYTGATDFAGKGTVVNVIIMLGTNDAQPQNWSVDGGNSASAATQYANDYRAMVDHFTSLPTHPIVYLAFPPTSYVSLVPDSLLTGQIIPIIQQVAAEKGMPTIDVHAATSGHPEYFMTSSNTLDLHPNDMGHQVIAQTMWQAITRQPLPSPLDAGTTTSDGGTKKNDAGPPALSDASVEETNNGSSSSGCNSGAASPGSYAYIAAIFSLIAIRRRRMARIV